MSAKIIDEPVRSVITIKSMKIGQIGTFKYGNETVIGLRTYVGVVDLNRPSLTWPDRDSDMEITLLPSGTIVEVKAE